MAQTGSVQFAKYYLDLYDNLTVTFNYRWGDWSNGNISLKIGDCGLYSGMITGPKSGSILANVYPLGSGSRKSVFTSKDFFYVRDGICQNFNHYVKSGTNGTVTIPSSYLNSNRELRVEIQVLCAGNVKVLTIDLQAPSYPVGSPSGRTSVTNITQTTADRSAVVGSWGSYATAGSWSWLYGPGNLNYNSGGATNKTLTGLTPNTTYNYQFKIWNGQGKTTYYTGTFKTLPYTPPSASISLNSLSYNSITVNYSTRNARIDRYNIYLNGQFYKTNYTSSSRGTFTISGLNPKTYYTISIQPHTPDGDLWGGQTGNLGATTYPYPVSINTNNTYMIEILPFSAKVSVLSSAPADTSDYGYTLLNANKGVLRNEVRSASSTYNWTNLTPETTYYARVRAFTKTSGVASGYYDIKFTTPPDQATVFVKTSNIWKRGKVFVKVQGAWIKSKYIYTKVQGNWRKNNNF